MSPVTSAGLGLPRARATTDPAEGGGPPLVSGSGFGLRGDSLLCSSSEDELDVLLNGTVEQKRRLLREYLTGESESSSGDDFEKEMEAELSSTLRTLEGSWGSPAAGRLHACAPPQLGWS